MKHFYFLLFYYIFLVVIKLDIKNNTKGIFECFELVNRVVQSWYFVSSTPY